MFTVYFSLAFCLYVAYRLLKRIRSKKHKSSGKRFKAPTNSLQSLIEKSICILNESNIATTRPVPLHGRVDQVLRLENGLHVVLDTKVRKKFTVYFSDCVQMSVYQLILKHQGMPMAPFGFVRIPIDTHRAMYISINLLPEEEVVALFHQYKAIEAGLTQAPCSCGRHKKKQEIPRSGCEKHPREKQELETAG